MGGDVVVVLDSSRAPARAYRHRRVGVRPHPSGGVDSVSGPRPPKRFWRSAQHRERRRLLTILASALIDTGSKMDEVIRGVQGKLATWSPSTATSLTAASSRRSTLPPPAHARGLAGDEQMRLFMCGIRRIPAGMNTGFSAAAASFIKGLQGTNSTRSLICTAKKAADHPMRPVLSFYGISLPVRDLGRAA